MHSPLRSAQLLVADDAAGAADAAAWVVAATIGQAIAARGRAVVAFSGGTTPALMFRALASGTNLPVPIDWSKVIVAQVDERWAPQGDPARNVGPLHDELLSRVGVAPDNRVLIPLPPDAPDDARRRDTAALEYARRLSDLGPFDLVHLGLGDDGHTASLIPGDDALEIDDRLTAVTGEYRGHTRITVTAPVLNAARSLVWLVTGPTKASALARLLAGDASIPAGRFSAGVVACDRAALIGGAPS